jgi:aminodeoxyfutalosine synthase
MENFLFSDKALIKIHNKVKGEERLSFDDGVRLFNSFDLVGLGFLANIVRERRNGNRTYFINNRHINPSNICVNLCKFCAFARERGKKGAYELSLKEIVKKAEEGARQGATEFHIVGALHPDLPFSYYLDILKTLSTRFLGIHLQAFTAVEIEYFSRISSLSLKETLKKLKEAGLGSIPGGGAEVFSPRLREIVCPKKISGETWLEVLRTAHKMGIKSNATMLYGHIETVEEKVDHLIKLRELQDETGGFMAFIPLAFHPRNTEMSDLRGTTGQQDLKHLAVSRLMLDNFPHIKAFWIMIGPKVSQISLSFGVDDIDGTVVEERITHSAGAETAEYIPREELIKLIKEAGRVPIERDTLYNAVA